MPKDTFYNLPEEKRKRILDAAAEEVIRVPASEMSINKIIQKAEISRGSFYQYFEDKHDLIQYMLSDYINILKDGIRTAMENCQGNIFDAALLVVDGVIFLGRDEKNQRGMKHIIGEADKKECSLEFMLGLQNEIVEILVGGVDRSLLKSDRHEEVVLLARLIFLLLKNAAIECLLDIGHADRVKLEFIGQLKMIKEGAEREKTDVKI